MQERSFIEAVELLDRVINIRGEFLGQTDPDYLASQRELAFAYMQSAPNLQRLSEFLGCGEGTRGGIRQDRHESSRISA